MTAFSVAPPTSRTSPVIVPPEVPAPSLRTPAQARTFEQDAVQVLSGLQMAIRSVIDSAPVRPKSPTDLSKLYGVDKALGWNVFRMSTAQTPLAVGLNVPARVSMERFLRAAQKHVGPDLLAAASGAFEAFERMAETHADDREELESMLVALLPEEREKAHKAQRETMYRCARDIRGISQGSSIFSAIIWPSSEVPGTLDLVRLITWRDARVLRRDAKFRLFAYTRTGRGENSITTLDDRPVERMTDIILPEFCSSPLPHMTADKLQPEEYRVGYALMNDHIGLRSSMDITFADVLPSYASMYASEERRCIGGTIGCAAPCRHDALDVLMCEGLVPPQQPRITIHDTCPDGFVRFLDSTRDEDIVKFNPTVRHMGQGVHGFTTPQIPRYTEMVEHICKVRGWDSSRLVGHRLEIEYPVYTWQCSMAFKLPDRPAAP